MPTIKDVAVRAGVAPSSVTRVLTGHPNVSAGLRERVMRAVTDVGYQPDLLAAGLRRGYTRTIGVIVSDILNPIVAELIDVLESELRQAGYSVLLANSHGRREFDRENLALLQQRRVDGLIASVSDDTDEELAAGLAALPGPVVLLDRRFETAELSAVLSDHRYGARLLVSHLIDQGHRRIGLISGSTAAYPGRERVTAVADALSSAGLPVEDALVVSGRGSLAFGTTAIAGMLDLPDPPTAVIVGNGNTAALVGVLTEIRRRGVAVGRDLAVAVAEDSPLAQLHTPPLTALERDIADLGRRAASMILDRVTGRTTGRHTVLLPTRLVVRDSTTGSPPAS